MIIELKDVCKQYTDSNLILQNINLSIDVSEKIGIIGKNGSGKSTILKLINGLEDVTRGEILYHGDDITSLPAKQQLKARKKLAYIFQQFNLIENKTVFYHLALVYRLNKENINHQEIDELLNFLDLYEHKNKKCSILSGGQKQKVTIAMAILQQPELILCDEISSALDSKSEREIFKLLKELCSKKNISMLVVSHNLDILKNNCHRILFLEDGQIKDEFIPNQNRFTQSDDYYQYVKSYLCQ